MSEISKLDQNLIIKKIDKETVHIQVTDNQMLMSIVGQFDQNLKDLSKSTNTNVFFRGNSITCKGKQENINIFTSRRVGPASFAVGRAPREPTGEPSGFRLFAKSDRNTDWIALVLCAALLVCAPIHRE